MRRLLKDIAEGRELGDVTPRRDPGVTELITGGRRGRTWIRANVVDSILG